MTTAKTALAGISAILLCINFPSSLAADPQDVRPAAVREERGEGPKPLTIFTPDRKLSAVLSTDGLIEVRSADGTFLRKFHQCSPIGAVFSPDGALLCSAGRPRAGIVSFKVWRLSDRKVFTQFTSNTTDIPLMAFSANNDLFASTVGRTRVALFEIPQGKQRWSIALNRPIAALSFEENDTVVVQHSGGKLKRLAVQDGKLLK